MTLRSRLATVPRPSAEVVPVSKVYGNAVPPQILAAEAQQQMTPASPFSPGEPIGPYDGYSRQPRTRDYVTGYNIATRPRLHERVSFDTLKNLVRSYDVASIAIWHRIDSLRSVRYRLVPADGYNGDVTGAAELGMQVLRSPDRRRGFKSWFGAWMYDVLAYDAGALYRLRNRAGRCIGLAPVDGCSLAPLLDYWGNSPEGDAPAYVQYVNGLPWNWLTRADVIYEPFRAVNDSIYGQPPIESIILNANTDIRFQLHFLQRFTSGNIPEAFASAPESWTPDQIENWQSYWDSFMYGDQSQKHQVKWMPGGSTIMWSNERDFTDAFSLFLMRKTVSAYHLVPTDLGFTDNANYSTGESQADVQHRVGELPLMEYTEEILSRFLYDDLGLPLKFEWDKGEDQDDRLVQAQADQTYINSAVVSADEIREMRFGLPTDQTNPLPRVFFTERGGPIPLNAVLGVAGRNDPETASPETGAPLPQMTFPGVPGVMDATVLQAPLAVDEYGPSALPPMPPQQPAAPGDAGAPVAKEGEAAAGITADTGIYGDPLIRGDQDEDEDQAAVAKELAAFRRYTRARRRAGEWRDFRFGHHSPSEAAALNAEGRAAVAKAGTGGTPKGTVKTLADQVYDQLTEDYPRDSLGWVHQARWEEPEVISFDQLDMSDRDSWRASHEPERVREFADRISARRAKGKTQLKKPAVVVFEKGKRKGIVIDGHHRTLGAEEAGEDGVLAWPGYVSGHDGPWMELHDRQFTREAGSAPGSGDDNARDQVGKGASGYDLNPRSGMISLDLPEGLIPPVPGGVTDHHVTVVYLGPDVGDEALAVACTRAQQAAAAAAGPLSGTVSGVGAFPPSDSSDGKVPAWAAVAIPGAEDIREALADLSASEFTGWQPHVTLAYLDPGDPLPAPLDPLPVTFTHLSVHCGGQVTARYPLGGEPVAKAGGPPKVWPGWEMDLPAADYWGQQVATALTTALTDAEAIQLANAWYAANPPEQQQDQGKRDAVAAAVLWLTSHGPDFSGLLKPLAAGIVTDGRLIGAVSAKAATDGTPADTGTWKPGDTAAATKVLGDLGLGRDTGTAADEASQAADSIAHGVRTALGRILVEGVEAGRDAADVARDVMAALADKAKAVAGALDQLVRAIGRAAMDWYRRRQVEYVEWAVDDSPNVCPACLANEAAGPVKLGSPFPSGDLSAPVHPHCRCTTLPSRRPQTGNGD